MNQKVRLLTFHLPQYHPIPENDIVWGKGFTEWANVTMARPLFRGHCQPHLPSELGFYDLRLPEARQAQADLAREYGIYGFCYYHYWLHGTRLLERPVNEILASSRPDFPFCLCWANEHWTRGWDGLEHEILVRQDYSHEDDVRHIRWLCQAFRDRRYVRIDGRPLFLIYRALRLPDPLRTTAIWREEARKLGIGELYLCRVESFVDEIGDPREIGFDAAVEFQPDWKNLGPPQRSTALWRLLRRLHLSNKVYRDHRVFDYSAMVERMLRKEAPAYKRFPCVNPGWDNSPRKKTDGVIIRNSTPELYEHWLRNVVARFEPCSAEENLVFVCAWNEWAEGNHLEPCRDWGRGYLEATRRAVEQGSSPGAGLSPRREPALKTQTATPAQPAAGSPFAGPAGPRLDDRDLSERFRRLQTAGVRSNPRLWQQVLGALDSRDVLLQLYNLASVLERSGDAESPALYRIISELAEKVNPELAGKALYKRALATSEPSERVECLRRATRLYPGHRAAAEMLRELSGRAQSGSDRPNARGPA